MVLSRAYSFPFQLPLSRELTIKWIQGFTSFLKRKSYELKRLLLKAKSLKTRERGRGIFRESQRGRKKQGS